jgi:DNA-binding NtrC family response regulator
MRIHLAVLIVDDDTSVCKLVAKILTASLPSILGTELGRTVDCECVTVEDAKTAIQLFFEDPTRFSIVITDLRMPDLDGLSMIRHLRERCERQVPIIIMTGYSTEATAIEALSLGVFGYMAKPLRADRLLTTVASCAKQARLSTVGMGFRQAPEASSGDNVLRTHCVRLDTTGRHS